LTVADLLNPSTALSATGWAWLVALALVATSSAWLTKLLATVLAKRGVLDRPNARSSHATPTPRGGGIAILVALCPAWIAAMSFAQDGWEPAGLVGGTALVLAALSFVDDIRSLSAGIRLLAQLGLIAGLLAVDVLPGPILGGLIPPALDMLVAFLAWAWFVNLFNFMDGIDGIAGAETVHLGVGVAVVAGLAGFGPTPMLLGLSVAAAAFGFLAHNWHPARIFMGDVGSVPLGLLLGWMLLDLAARGEMAAAALLPLYYLADATVTLLTRLGRGEKIWQAHRSHFYQRSAAGQLGHDGMVRTMLVMNLILLGLAVGTLFMSPTLSVSVGAIITILYLLYLDRQAGAPQA